jgi:ferritin-like metal-binding protein YciE
MRRSTPALIAIVLVVSALAAFPVAGLAAQTTESTATPTENATVTPGEQLSGVVGVQDAELEGEVQSRAYGSRIANASGNDSRAAVVAEQLGDIEQHLTELEQRGQALDEARENGSMSEGQYRARIARLAAETQTVERLANQSNATVQDLPAKSLEAKGLNATAIKTLSERASELGGPEVAEIARSIAGENVGNGLPMQAEDRRPGAAENGIHGQDHGDDTRDGGQNSTSEADRTAGQNSTDTDGQQSASGQDAGSEQTTETTADTETTDSNATATETETRRDGSNAGGSQGR